MTVTVELSSTTFSVTYMNMTLSHRRTASPRTVPDMI